MVLLSDRLAAFTPPRRDRRQRRIAPFAYYTHLHSQELSDVCRRERTHTLG